MESYCSWMPARLPWATQLSGSFKGFVLSYRWTANWPRSTTAPGATGREKPPQKIIRSCQGPRRNRQKWLVKQAIWQIYLPALRRIPRPKFDVPTPKAVHQADLLFLPNEKLPRGRKVYKYALVVLVPVPKRFKVVQYCVGVDFCVFFFRNRLLLWQAQASITL